MKFNKVNKLFLLRLSFSIGLVVIILVRVEIDKLFALLSSIKFSFFFLSVFLDLLERVLLAYRWNILLTVKSIEIAFLKIVKICFVSTFVGTFLPSSVGGDIFRVYSLHKYGVNSSEAISSVFVERITSFVSALIIAFASVLLYFKVMYHNGIFHGVLMAAVFVCIFLFLVTNKFIMRRFIDNCQFVGLYRVKKRIGELYEAFIGYNVHNWMLLYVLALSFLFQLVRVLVTYAGSLALNQDMDIGYFFIFVPIIILATLLPISVGGIGVREGAFIYLFSQAGMSYSDAFTLSLLLYMVTIVAMSPGGMIYVVEGIVPKKGSTIINHSSTG